MRIAIDAMGSDNHPGPDVAGGVLAGKESGDTIVLVGDQALIKRHLVQHDTNNLDVEIVHAPQKIDMSDRPATVGKLKSDSSMYIGMNLVANGHADAFVTVGNTGAAQAIAMLHTLRRIRGVKRPALSAIFHIADHPVIFLDIGANTDSKPEWLAQFAVMGSVYAANALGLMQPRVGLLSVGTEDGKGNLLVRESGAILQHLSLNYIGNIEPVDILHGHVDIVVSDGFVGNILLKTFEATSRYLVGLIRDEIKQDTMSSIGGLLSRPAFNRVRSRTDTAEIGGAPLLGVNGIVVIGHGSANAKAIKNAVLQARQAVMGGVIEAIQAGIIELDN